MRLFIVCLALLFSTEIFAQQTQDSALQEGSNVGTVATPINQAIDLPTKAEQFSLWNRWVLVIVSLDKKERPKDKAELSMQKTVKISKNNGPTITIEETDLGDKKGRLIRLQCDDTTITQKFDTVNQLTGWAIQTTCKKNSYVFLINPAS